MSRESGSIQLDPELAAHFLNVGFAYIEDLGRFGSHGAHFEVAGSLDRQAKLISVSTKFSPEVMRFTAAHEIGHWLLHPWEVMHRDRPLKELSHQPTRPKHEKEADYFAACFLVPEKLTRVKFERFFESNKFIFNDANAFHFSPSDPWSLLRPREGSLDRELALATAVSYGGFRFDNLAKQFGVSATTMAIRIKELGLIQD